MDSPEKISGAVPPHSVEAETSVLGAMLQDSDAVLKALELLTMLTGAATGNMTTTGIGLMNSGGGSLTSRLAKVRKIVIRRKSHLIRLNGLLIRNMVYVKDSDFDFVLDFLIQHCPKAKVRGRR